jgi:hypothetical protein
MVFETFFAYGVRPHLPIFYKKRRVGHVVQIFTFGTETSLLSARDLEEEIRRVEGLIRDGMSGRAAARRKDSAHRWIFMLKNTRRMLK